MAEEIEDSAFFREDCSTESEWEVFHAQLRELFQDLELSNDSWGREFKENELFSCKWEKRCERLELLNKALQVEYFSAILNDEKNPTTNVQLKPLYSDLMSSENTFGTSAFDRSTSGTLHPLARYYGLRRFVVIHPATHYFTSPSEFSFFLSAAIVAASESCAAVPIFVQIYDPKWNYFRGVGAASMLRTNFDVVVMEEAPANWRYLNGLLSMFHEKIGEAYTEPATVSVRMTFKTKRSVRIPGNIPFMKVPKSSDSNNQYGLSTSQFVALPHGFFPDSHTELYVSYTWPEMTENMANDSPFNSDFKPLNAPIGAIYQKTYANSYLSSCLGDYLKLRGSKETVESFVGNIFTTQGNTADAPNPLDKLTESKFYARTHRDAYKTKKLNVEKAPKKIRGPITEFELEQMLLYIFPDIQPDVALWPYEEKFDKKKLDPHRVKSAVPDSLVMRLSCLLANCNAHFGSSHGLSQLWAAFVRELRLMWDNGLLVPGISGGFPDTRTCLLHQKLQMLNVCVERRRQREFGIKINPNASRTVKRDNESGDAQDAAGAAAANSDNDNDNDESKKSDDIENDDDLNDDEFYDCDEELQSNNSNRPEGRLKRLGDLKLLNGDEAIYVPVTQEIVPKTEDQLHEDAEVMLKSGSGSGLTAQMMCSSLQSDMEAFKAANPEARIEDFIRWYSPKDWEETVDELGETTCKLSPRMTGPDNTWMTVWNEAQPVPAWRQKRLFDETQEALKVLQYIESRTIGEIFELTVIASIHSAILKLKDILNQCQILDLFNAKIDEILAELSRLSHDIEIINEAETSTIIQLPNPEDIIKQLEALEGQFYQYKNFEVMADYPKSSSLNVVKQKFKEALENGGGACNMAIHKNVKASTGDVGNSIFGSEEGDLKLNPRHELHENLISKEYVIRTENENQPMKEQFGPQFLRAIVTGESLRLCGAFTESTTFI